MSTTFGAFTKTFIKATLLKNNTSVLELIMLNEKRADKIAYRVLSYVIYTIIKNDVCIDDIACQSKQLSEIPVGSGGGSKQGHKFFTEYWVLEFQIC